VRAGPLVIEPLRTVADAPIDAICYSHGHLAHKAAVGGGRHMPL
jgi:hypothetical protein